MALLKPTALLATLLAILGASVMLPNLGGGEVLDWDEALQGRLARNALTHDRYLIPVDEDGNYSHTFSKPPLALWAIAEAYARLGPSPFALRLPFALSVIGLALWCFAFGLHLEPDRRLAPWFGFTWGALVVLSEGAMHWGRRSCIEPLLCMFLVAALYLHARALDAARPAAVRGFALGSGLALGLAFLTKQLACGLAAIPIVVVELWMLRKRPGLAVQRLTISATTALLIAGMWLWQAHTVAGKRLFDVFFGFSIQERMAGLGGRQHFRHLNRVAYLLDEVHAPMSWELGAFGLFMMCMVALVLRRGAGAPSPSGQPAEPRRLTSDGLWLLPCFALTLAWVYDGASKSLLAWYAFSFVVPLLAGAAWLLVHGAFQIRQRLVTGPCHEASLLAPWQGVVLGAAVLLVLSTVSRASDPVLSRTWLVAMALGLGAGAILAKTPRARHLTGLTLAAGLLAVLVLSVVRRETYWRDPDPLGEVMAVLGQVGSTRVAVASSLGKPTKRRVNYFGTHAVARPQPPWSAGSKAAGSKAAGPKEVPFDAWVDTRLVPSEVQPPAGMRVHRAGGAVAWTGDLRRPPYQDQDLVARLAQGPLTFEAEHMASPHPTTLVRDPSASGGRARAYRPWLNTKPRRREIAAGKTIYLPAGDYLAVFVVRWACRGFNREHLANLEANVGRAISRTRIRCKLGQDPSDWQRRQLRFKLPKRSPVSLSAASLRGSLMLDRIELWAADSYPASQDRAEHNP